MGMRPAKAMATLASARELGGGVLTATGLAYPLGPLAIAGAMSVATAVHRKPGPMSQKRGFELPLTNLALAIGLMSSEPGRLVLGPRLPKPLTRIAVLAAVGNGRGLAITAATREAAGVSSITRLTNAFSRKVENLTAAVSPSGRTRASPPPFYGASRCGRMAAS